MLSALAAIVGALVLTGGGRGGSAAPPTIDGCIRADSQARLVRFAAGRGDELKAAVFGKGSAAVVLSNQSDRDLCSWLPFARSLERSGFRVLVFDYSGLDPWLEVAAAAAALHRLGAPRVALVGASEGTKASIIAAAKARTPVSAVVNLSAERYLQATDVKPWAAKLRRPVLFIVARKDPYAAADTPTLYRACHSPVKKLVVVAGAAHVIDLLGTGTGAAVSREVLMFLRRTR